MWPQVRKDHTNLPSVDLSWPWQRKYENLEPPLRKSWNSDTSRELERKKKRVSETYVVRLFPGVKGLVHLCYMLGSVPLVKNGLQRNFTQCLETWRGARRSVISSHRLSAAEREFNTTGSSHTWSTCDKVAWCYRSNMKEILSEPLDWGSNQTVTF